MKNKIYLFSRGADYIQNKKKIILGLLFIFLTICTSVSLAEDTSLKQADQLFLHNLKPGSIDKDVVSLQKYLNANGFTIAFIGKGSIGNETNYFGLLTKSALIRFQEHNADKILSPLGLIKGTGNFFEATRNFINAVPFKTIVPNKINKGSLSGKYSHAGPTTVTTPHYSISGSISGLSGTIELANNSSDILTTSSNGSFTFNTSLASGSSYLVTVLSQPVDQTCVVDNDSGTATAIVTSIVVTCSTHSYTIGGNVTGLSGTVVLQNNLANNLSLSSSGNFTFTSPLLYGASYSVTVLTQPTSQLCLATSNSGSGLAANVTSVDVACLSYPTLSFANIIKFVGDAPFELSPTSNSVGSFSFTSSDPTIVSVSGITATILWAGTSGIQTTTITAQEATTTSYTASSTAATLTVYPNICDIEEPCLNGGACTNEVVSGSLTFSCSCTGGFSGDLCELSASACDAEGPSACLNGGTCTPTTGGGECACAMCYGGPQCELLVCLE